MSDSMTNRDHLRTLSDAATPGPWEADYSEENNYAIKSPGTEWGDGYAYVSDRDNAEFIAAARTAVPQLLFQLAQAEKRIRDLTREVTDERDAALEQMEQVRIRDARIRHLEDTARVLVRGALDTEAERDRHRRGKVEAEERIEAWEKQYAQDIDYWIDAAETDEARIKAVRELHQQAWNGTLGYCRRCVDYEGAIWPCGTIRALDGEAG